VSKSTPGPWRVSDNNHNILSDSAGDRPVLVGTAFHDLNKLSRGIDSDWEHDECHANARLIAAAPELLDACKALVEWYDSDGEFRASDQDRWACIYNQMKAAIAKAESIQD
jgi:hypothetical protein